MFDQAAITTLISNVASNAKSLGIFQQVLKHEPKSAPQSGVTLSVWWTDIKPSRTYTDLYNTAGVVTFTNRVYINMLAKPEDAVERDLMTATSAIINGYSESFSLGSTVIGVDLLGMEGTPLSASTGYVNVGSILFRAATITVPVIIDKLWSQAA